MASEGSAAFPTQGVAKRAAISHAGSIMTQKLSGGSFGACRQEVISDFEFGALITPDMGELVEQFRLIYRLTRGGERVFRVNIYRFGFSPDSEGWSYLIKDERTGLGSPRVLTPDD